MFRIAFNTLYAAEGTRTGKSGSAFLSVLRESIYWQIDGEKHDDEISVITDGIINNLK